MKLSFFQRSAEDQAVILRETAARRGLPLAMVEKDFWVSWMLAVLFSHSEFASELVFKGGTSLSKVFGVINRFSEDIDLSMNPAFLGISEQSVEAAGSRHQRDERMKELEDACIEKVLSHFLPELERIASASLGSRPGGGAWMVFEVDAGSHSPVVLFHYPSSDFTGFEYLRRFVKLEFGALTDQRPVVTHLIQPWAGETFPAIFADFRCNLVALELERTFWEKATILHAEHHRDPAKPMRDRFSRHYSDMAALANHAVANSALAAADLRQRVVDWKSRFFAAGWARYDLARPGTFRLVPPEARLSELESDYGGMQDMFIHPPVSFNDIIATLNRLEQRINA